MKETLSKLMAMASVGAALIGAPTVESFPERKMPLTKKQLKARAASKAARKARRKNRN